MATKENMAAKDKVAPKKRRDIKIATGTFHVHTTDNNTIISLIDENGNKVL
jgi:ribosomal protein S11